MAETSTQAPQLNSQPITLNELNQVMPMRDDDAYIAEKEKSSNPHGYPSEAILREMREELARLTRENAILASAGKRAEPTASSSVKPPVRFEELLAKHNWNGLNKLTRAQKVELLQADPSWTDEQLRTWFGRGCSAQVQMEFQRNNPQGYARARELAKTLQIYAN